MKRIKKNDSEKKLVVIEVEDYATGIPENVIDQIWERGYSTKSPDKINIVRGQGLHIVRKHIASQKTFDKEAMITVESPVRQKYRDSMNGTKFTLTFTKINEIVS